MGAETFKQTASGPTAELAFTNAVDAALYSHGHSGYTGTIAEKDEFVLIDLPSGQDASAYSDQLINQADPRIDDKWGPAGCIELGGGEYLFFGWASS